MNMQFLKIIRMLCRNESKIELFISTEIIVEKEKLSFKNKFIFQNSFSDIGPPIYITVSSLSPTQFDFHEIGNRRIIISIIK